MTLEEALEKVNKHKLEHGSIIGWAASSFDLLHAGHVLFLKDCKEHCDFLVAGLQTDPTLDRAEKNKPILSLEERRIVLEAIRYVDLVIEYDTEERHREILRNLNPHVMFKGSDHRDKKILEDEGIIPIHFHERNHNWSTSSVRERVFCRELIAAEKWYQKTRKDLSWQ